MSPILVLLFLAVPRVQGESIDFTGYLVDAFCWNKPAYEEGAGGGNGRSGKAEPAKQYYPPHTAPPAGCIDLATEPEKHTIECLRDIPVCLKELYLLDRADDGTYFVKYTFDEANMAAVQDLIKAQEGEVDDISARLDIDSCNGAVPDFSLANGAHAMPQVHVRARSTGRIGQNTVQKYPVDAPPDGSIELTDVAINVVGSEQVFTADGVEEGGDEGPPKSEFTSETGKLNVQWTLGADDDISFTVEYDQASGWFALAVSSDGSMLSSGDGSDFVVCDGNGVTRYWATDKSPPPDLGNNVGAALTSASCTFTDGKGVLEFTRPLTAGDSEAEGRTVMPSGETHFLWAHGDSDTIMYHGTKKGTVAVDVSTGGVSSSKYKVPTLIALHAVLMISSWGFLLPLGVLVAHNARGATFKVPTTKGRVIAWFGFHYMAQHIGALLMVGGFVAIWIEKRGAQFVGSGQLHMKVGLAVVVMGFMQPFIAYSRNWLHLHPHKDKNPAKPYTPCNDGRTLWEWVHKGVGWTAVILGWLNCFVAYMMLSQPSSFVCTDGACGYNFESWLQAIPATVLGVEVVVALIVAVTWYIPPARRCMWSWTGCVKQDEHLELTSLDKAEEQGAQ